MWYWLMPLILSKSAREIGAPALAAAAFAASMIASRVITVIVVSQQYI
jgi:hypothetical protein